MRTVAKLLRTPIPQPQSYHEYADHREWLGIPYAANVLSNLPILAVGFVGLFRKNSSPSLKLMNLGLITAALGSAYYHLAPDDQRLAWDRLGMSVALAGALGSAAEESNPHSKAKSSVTMMATLVANAAAIIWWQTVDDVRGYAASQGAATLHFRQLAKRAPSDKRGRMMALYWSNILAKACELLDGPVWRMTGERISGHTLKHLLLAVGFGLREFY
jgi:hypothetical protein